MKKKALLRMSQEAIAEEDDKSSPTLKKSKRFQHLVNMHFKIVSTINADQNPRRELASDNLTEGGGDKP